MSLGKKRQHWLDADDNEVYASELRTAAAIYISELETKLAAETQRADEAEGKLMDKDEMLRTLYRRYILNGQTYDEWLGRLRKLVKEWVEP